MSGDFLPVAGEPGGYYKVSGLIGNMDIRIVLWIFIPLQIGERCIHDQFIKIN